MRFRLAGDTLHVHRCDVHPTRCDFFDHVPAWLVGNRDAARAQLLTYRASVLARIAVLTETLAAIDRMLHRLDSIRTS